MSEQIAKVKSEDQDKKQQQLPQLPSPMKKKNSVCEKNFNNLGKIGKGAYGNVYLVEKEEKLYAMKQIEKKKLSKQGKQYQALVQRELLTKMKHPGIVQLHFTFQDPNILYFVLQYCEGGSFTDFIKLNYNKLSHQIKVFYIAEIVQILQYLHLHGITHRDLKPENLMLTKHGHIKVIDFGTADFSKSDLVSEQFKNKINKTKKNSTAESQKSQNSKEDKSETQISNDSAVSDNNQQDGSPRKKFRRATFVGTPYYISPELLEQNMCEAPSDLWALGCIIYQMFYLYSPFQNGFEYLVYEKIKSAQFQFPKNQFITDEAIDLIKKLIVKDPYKRLGSGETQELTYDKLKAHPFFKGIKFKNIFEQPIPDTKDETEVKQQQLLKNYQKIERTKTEMQQIMSKQLTEQNSKDILIHGVLDKKTFITYTMYYFIVYNDLSVKRIKCQNLQSEKTIKIKYKMPLNLSSSLKLNKSENASQKTIQNSNSPSLPCKIISGCKFQLIADEKTYNLKASTPQQALKWVNKINDRAKTLRSQWLMDSDSD